MAKVKKKKAASKKRPPAEAKVVAAEHDDSVDAVSELISVLACPKSAVDELALSCEHVLDQVEVSCGFARFAAMTWANQPGPYREIDPIARALIAEYERHAEAISDLLDRLAPLAEEDAEGDHEDLAPKDVFARIEPMLTAASNA